MIANYLLLSLFSFWSCFVSSTFAREAITNGELADENNRFPYQVSVQVHGHGYVCGGCIIDDKFILTAARCVLNRDRQFLNSHISIHAGTMAYNRTEPPAVTVKVHKIYFPSEYQPTAKYTPGDIAVLRVDSLGLEHHSNLEKIKVPRNYRTSQSAMIAGFGWHFYRMVNDRWVGGSDGRLRFAKAYIYNNDRCQQDFLPGEIQTDAHLCAAIRNVQMASTISTCFEDVGGPLVYDGTVIGILSRIPPRCNEALNPGVYTRVGRYRKIISSAMQNKNNSDMISVYPFPY